MPGPSPPTPGRRRRPAGWQHQLDEVTTTVRCGGETHHITWQRGRLRVVDHDLAAEAALAALGAKPPACLDVVEGVRRYLRRLPVTGLWSAEGDPAGLILAAGPGPATSQPRVPSSADEQRLDTLRALSGPFRRRLALAAFVAASRGPSELSAWQAPLFGAVLTSVVVPAVRRSLHDAGCPFADHAALDVRWVTAGPDAHPRLEGRVGGNGGWAKVTLSAAWVAEVWAAGLAQEGGRLVLGRGGPRHGFTWAEAHDGSWSAAASDQTKAGSSNSSVPMPQIQAYTGS